MQLLGLILGFFLGHGLLGPLGALLGAFLGYQFMLELGQQRFSQQSTDDSSPLIKTLFATLGYLNKLKGRVTEQDIQLAEQWMQALRLTESERSLAQHSYREGKHTDFSLQQQLLKFRNIAALRPDWLQLFLQAQLQAAVQTGLHLPAVQEVLQLFIRLLPLSSRQLQQLLNLVAVPSTFGQEPFQRYRFHWQRAAEEQFHNEFTGNQTASQTATVAQAYQLLGVSSDAEPATIKRAYRKLMLQHHPDKLIAQGLSNAQMEQTKQRAQAIQAAFDLIKRQRNFK